MQSLSLSLSLSLTWFGCSRYLHSTLIPRITTPPTESAYGKNRKFFPLSVPGVPYKYSSISKCVNIPCLHNGDPGIILIRRKFNLKVFIKKIIKEDYKEDLID